jgi:hypothetical protein
MRPLRWLPPLRRRVVAVALPLALLVALAACSGKDEPTVAEAGTQLQQAVQRLYAKQLGRGEPRVSSDAGADQACGDGRAKRVYAATVRTRGFSDRPTAFDYAVGLMDDLGSGWERQSTKDSNDTVTSVGADGHARLSVITRQDGTSYSVAGETDCLPTS